MANQEQNPLQQEQPFVAAKQVGLNLKDIILNINNEIFKALENSKVSFSIPTGGIYREVGVNTFRNAIGAHYLRHSSEYIAPPSIDIVRPWFETIGGVKLEEDMIIKLNKKQREKVVPYTRFLSLLMMHKMKEGYEDAKLVVFKAPKPYSNAERVSQGKPRAQPEHKKHSTSSKQPYVSSQEAIKVGQLVAQTLYGSPVKKEQTLSSVVGMNEETKSTSYDHLFAGIDPHVLADQTQSISEGLETVLTQCTIDKGASNITKQIKDIEASRTIKLEDLVKLVQNVQPSFKDLDSPEDDSIIVVDDSDEYLLSESQFLPVALADSIVEMEPPRTGLQY
ncbi:hypothetical protein Tco_0532548 [Tanacetum coccineum]